MSDEELPRDVCESIAQTLREVANDIEDSQTFGEFEIANDLEQGTIRQVHHTIVGREYKINMDTKRFRIQASIYDNEVTIDE